LSDDAAEVFCYCSLLPASPNRCPRSSRAVTGLSQPSAGAVRARPEFTMPRDIGDTYWKEGGIVTALAGVILANSLAPAPSIGDRVSGSILMALIFFWPGALIGKQFLKD
jgi:hypothetical protein